MSRPPQKGVAFHDGWRRFKTIEEAEAAVADARERREKLKAARMTFSEPEAPTAISTNRIISNRSNWNDLPAVDPDVRSVDSELAVSGCRNGTESQCRNGTEDARKPVPKRYYNAECRNGTTIYINHACQPRGRPQSACPLTPRSSHPWPGPSSLAGAFQLRARDRRRRAIRQRHILEGLQPRPDVVRRAL
jgi:hypothetical protein